MARNRVNPKKIIGIAAALVVVLALTGAATLLFLKGSTDFAKLPAFPVDTYLNGGDLWSYEKYKIECRIDNVLLRSEDKTSLLISVQPDGSDVRLPVLVARDENNMPVQREQNLILEVSLGNSREIICGDYVSQ